MTSLRCKFMTTQVEGDVLYLEDRDGRVSMTNDAENVTSWAHDNYPGKRVVYKDSMGRWDEMVHESGRFLAFRPWHGGVPS